MDIQFSSHAVERVCGRLSSVVSYGEVQSELSRRELRPGMFRVCIKKLSHSVTVKDDTALGGQVKGNKVFALIRVTKDGAIVDTIALSFI
jgi:hypothetical protein